MATTITNLTKNGKITSIQEALEASNLNFLAEQIPLVGMNGQSIPTHKSLFRADTNSFLGVVGNTYFPTQNFTSFAFADAITQKHGYSYTEAISKNNGEVSIIVAQSDRAEDIRPGDQVCRRIKFINSFNGKTPLSVSFEMIRLVCSNGMTRSENISQIRLRHTTSITDRMSLALKVFDDSVEFHDEFVATSKMLAQKAVDKTMVERFLNGLFSDAKQNDAKKDIIEDLFQNGLGNGHGSLFDLYSGATEYVQHHHGKDEKRLEYATFGSGRTLTDKAWELAVSML